MEDEVGERKHTMPECIFSLSLSPPEHPSQKGLPFTKKPVTHSSQYAHLHQCVGQDIAPKKSLGPVSLPKNLLV